MSGNRHFILTEALAMLPLVRQILVDVREARARLSSIERRLGRGELPEAERLTHCELRRAWQGRLADSQTEAARLGIEVTSGVRCEACFPFLHQWTGPSGDGQIRRAYFLYSDEQSTITHWVFAGWPDDRRTVWPDWRRIHRPGDRAVQTA